MTQKEYYERLLAEKDRTIRLLASLLKSEASIEYIASPSKAEPELPFSLEESWKSWVSEEEEDLKELVQSGSLTAREAEAALAELTENPIT